MADIMQTDTRTLLRQRVKACIKVLNDYAITAGAVIPLDWYNHIDLERLNMEHPALCVFGQLFRDVSLTYEQIKKYKKLRDFEPCVSHGYCRGLVIFAPATGDKSVDWGIDHGLTTDSFIEDESYTNERQWADLTSIWIDEIGKARLFASTAEGVAIMTESEND